MGTNWWSAKSRGGLVSTYQGLHQGHVTLDNSSTKHLMVAKEAGRIAGVQNEDPSVLSQEDSESSKAKVQIKGSTLKENHVLMGLMGGAQGLGLWPRHCPWQGRAE